MTNKELAVQLYCAYMQQMGAILASPNAPKNVAVPNAEQIVEAVASIQRGLSKLDDL